MQKFKEGCWILVLAITVPYFNLSAQEDDILVRARLAFYDGITQKLLKNETEAVHHFRTAVKLDPTLDAAFYNMADIFISSGRPSEAQPNAEIAYQLNPDNFWYGLLLVRTNSELKRFREAAVVLENMRKQNPQNADLVLMLADVQEKGGQWKNALKTLDLISPDVFNGNQWADFRSNIMARNLSDKQLERAYRKEIERFPDVDIYRLRLADLYRAMRRYKDALSVLNALAAQQPLHPLIDLSMAQIYRDMGQNEESYSAIIRAFKNPFADPDTKIQLLGNMVQQALREPLLRDRAMEMVTLLLEQYPNEAKLHLMKGDLHFEEKQDLKALKSYEKVLALGSKSFVAFRQTMSLAAHMQAFDLLLPVAREAVDLFPTHPTPYLYLAEALVQQKLYAAAEDTIRLGLLQVVSTDKPNTRQLNVLLARSLYGQNRHEEAQELLEDLTREFPGNTMVAVEYARFLWKSANNREAALAKLEEAGSFSNGNVAFNILNGEMLLEAEKNEQALEAFQKALRQGGATAILLETIGDTYLKMGDVQKALDHWKRALDLYGADKVRLDEKIKQHATK
jgi:tetratricopeptide (TPR) repeat protein